MLNCFYLEEGCSKPLKKNLEPTRKKYSLETQPNNRLSNKEDCKEQTEKDWKKKFSTF